MLASSTQCDQASLGADLSPFGSVFAHLPSVVELVRREIDGGCEASRGLSAQGG